jgi:hypothetical protein
MSKGAILGLSEVSRQYSLLESVWILPLLFALGVLFLRDCLSFI